MKLTKEEQELIAAKRKVENDKLPKKRGFLKADLYTFNSHEYDQDDYCGDWFFDKKEMDERIETFSKAFEKVASKGDKFECFIYNGKEEWYDEIYGIEAQDAEWAKKHLINIKAIARNIK